MNGRAICSTRLGSLREHSVQFNVRIEEINPAEFSFELNNKELQFVVQADRWRVFEFQSGDDHPLKHLEKQKAPLEAEIEVLERV